MATNPTFYFSNLSKIWHWLTCSLCGKEIVLIKDEIEHKEDVICTKCLMAELHVESMVARPDLYGL